MSARRTLAVRGIGTWLQGAPDWPSLRRVLRGECGLDENAPAKPAANILPAAERRRAPDGVRLAAEVAAQACAMANCDPATLPCVFASTHGELTITDYVCATLASAPRELSPTRFHNSVLNAPAGYWTIATGCTAASSAVTAYRRSFAAGLLEAIALACAEDHPVLYSSADVPACGPLAAMVRTTRTFGVALVLSPQTIRGAQLAWSLRADNRAGFPLPRPPLQASADDNPANAHALALLSALAGDEPSRLALPLSNGLSLDMEITP